MYEMCGGSERVKGNHKKASYSSVSYSDSGHALAPLQVSQLDWVETVWPRELREAQTDPTNDLHKMMYPKVQK